MRTALSARRHKVTPWFVRRICLAAALLFLLAVQSMPTIETARSTFSEGTIIRLAHKLCGFVSVVVRPSLSCFLRCLQLSCPKFRLKQVSFSCLLSLVYLFTIKCLMYNSYGA